MPRLKPISEKMERDRVFSENVKHAAKVNRYTPQQVCARLGISESAYYARLKEPDRFTRGELVVLCKMFHWSGVEIVGEAK